MLTKNWYTLFKSQRARIVIPNAVTSISGKVRNAGYYTSLQDYVALCNQSNAVQISTSYPKGICVGSGVTPPTADDYKLESMITSDFSSVIATTLDANNDTVWTITITNTSSEDMTIGEVGYANFGYYGAGTSSDYFLFDRTVLDEPLIIPAGGIGQVTYTIRMNYPTA